MIADPITEIREYMHPDVYRAMTSLGFAIGHTGGNCTAWILFLPDGGEVLITTDASAPDSLDDEVCVGGYPMTDEGEPISEPVLWWEGTLRDYLETLYAAGAPRPS